MPTGVNLSDGLGVISTNAAALTGIVQFAVPDGKVYPRIG
jgi:hypothetical protein